MSAVWLSYAPRVLLQHEFLTQKECAVLIKLAKEQGLRRARVHSDEAMTQITDDDTRTSEYVDVPSELERRRKSLRRVIERMHAFARIPVQHGEALQIGRYLPGEKYEFHRDSMGEPWAPGSFTADLGGERVVELGGRAATVLVYLSNVTAGGHTVFPYVRADAAAGVRSDAEDIALREPPTSEEIQLPRMQPYCDEERLLRVAPRAGTALLFYNHLPNGSYDPRSLHGGCPPIGDTKWFAQRFIFEQPLPASVAAHGPMYRSPYEPAMRTADRRPGCMADARSDPPTVCASAAMQRECAQSCEVALQEWRAQTRDEL